MSIKDCEGQSQHREVPENNDQANQSYEIPASLQALQTERDKYKRRINWALLDSADTDSQNKQVNTTWPYYNCQSDPTQMYNQGIEGYIRSRKFFKLSQSLTGYVLTMTKARSHSDNSYSTVLVPETRETQLPFPQLPKPQMRVRSTDELEIYYQLMISTHGQQHAVREMAKLMDSKNQRVIERTKVFKEFLPETQVVENATRNARLFRMKLKQDQNIDLEGINEIAILQPDDYEKNTEPLELIDNEPEYNDLVEILLENPTLRQNVAKFIDRCKRYYRHTNLLPEINQYSLRYKEDGTLLLTNLFGEVGLINKEGKKEETAMGIHSINEVKTKAETEINEWNMGLKNIQNLQIVGIADEFGQAPVLQTIQTLYMLETALQIASSELEEETQYKIKDTGLYEMIWPHKIVINGETIGMDEKIITPLAEVLYELNA